MLEVLYAENNTELPPAVWNDIECKLADNDRMRMTRYKKWQDRQACLLGRYLLMKWLEQKGKSVSEIKKIRLSPYGRPYIPDMGIDFNISHSNGYVLCAILNSQHYSVGIDIEYITIIDVSELAGVFHEEEYSKIKSNKDMKAAFYKLWTTAEAVLKAQGKGLLGNLKKVMVKSSSIAMLDNQVFYTRELCIHSDYIAVVGCTSEFDTVTIKKIDYIHNI